MSTLDQLKQYTKVVADTGDFESMKQYKPIDATTNPSLIYKSARDEKYSRLIDEAVEYAKKHAPSKEQQMSLCMDKVAVNFGMEILDIVPGRVSTEADARLSFDTEGTIEKARNLINLYEEAGANRKRILIKVASTWEGILAAKQLEKENIHTNLTLLFSKTQAIACAESGVTLVSPFVGRIYDWYRNHRGVDSIPAPKDPGVHSVQGIYNYFKKFGYATEIMGASFRNTGEILELTGCDLLTISPKLLKELEESRDNIQPKLTPEKAAESEEKKITMDEKCFRWYLNEDAMATEKLAEGIRRFSRDLEKLEEYVAGRF
ncbi:MAG: transaldolase [Bacteroidales bacterium]|nr:transaldolase [Bacteroidales bacterium]